jgi:signal transduction histidine kinase
MFQSIRELLFNVVKHAGTKYARVEMSGNQKFLCVIVADQGSGFDPSTIWDKAQSGTGFGLFSIRERLSLMGGNLEAVSSPGKGTSFSLIIPYERRKAERGKNGMRI